MLRKVFRTGNSLVVSLPREALEFLNIQEGAEIGVDLDRENRQVEKAMVAPQANAMAAVIQPLMSNVAAPWILYLVGALLALILVAIGIPPLAFALGMYIPQELNTPLVFGGLVAWWVSSRTKDEKLNAARASRGTLIASGFIAGGSLLGVFNAVLRFVGLEPPAGHWAESQGGEIFGLVMFLLLFAFMVWYSMKAKVED